MKPTTAFVDAASMPPAPPRVHSGVRILKGPETSGVYSTMGLPGFDTGRKTGRQHEVALVKL